VNDFADLRRAEFGALEGGGVYLNSASIGPVPSRALAVLAACNRDRGRPGMWPIERINAILTEARWLAGRLVNATEHEIALMPNTTTGLNIAARALPLRAGDIVVTFDGEFPANVYPWLRLAENGVTLERIPRTAEGWPDEAAMHRRIEDPRVKAVTVSLTQFSNGYTIDLARLSSLTRAAGKWLVVDAIQGAGHVSIDVQATPVDFLACGAQKWLLSPWGTGFLYVRKELCATLEPTFAGWAAYAASADYSSLTSYDQQFWPDARRFELLSHAIQDFAAFNASLGLILGLGVERIATHTRALHAPLLEWARTSGATVTSPGGAAGSAILCIRPAEDAAAVYARIQSAGVLCSLREGSLRFSPHLFNGIDEMQQVVEILSRA
jgi:selenocysteine lyase/cysteine desulfurase